MRRPRLLPWLLALLLWAPAAHAGRFDWAAELRAGALAAFGSAGQFGDEGPNPPCGVEPNADGGFLVSATAALLWSGRGYRHQLGATAGYASQYCTPALRRPVFGLMYSGEHSLGERTRLRAGLRANIDAFDRTLDIRVGTLGTDGDPMMANQPLAAGSPYLTGQLNVELEHAFSRLYGARFAVALQSLEVLDSLSRLSIYSTLGPMESVELLGAAYRDDRRNRFETILRYRVSQLYAATWLGILDRSELPWAAEVDLRGAWERKLNPRWTLHLDAGVAVAVQQHLCSQFDKKIYDEDRCSLDERAPGIRGYDAPPPLEAQLGRRGTLTFVGDLSLGYSAPRRRFEVRLSRGYEPDPYAGALSLIDRLRADGQWRPLWPLSIYGSVQVMHIAQTSPGRVSAFPGRSNSELLSPQNRTLYLAIGSLGVDYQVLAQLSLFAEASFFAMGIRGERVPGTNGEVSPFPLPPDDNLDDRSYQSTGRFSLLLGVRVLLEPGRREAELLATARNLPN